MTLHPPTEVNQQKGGKTPPTQQRPYPHHQIATKEIFWDEQKPHDGNTIIIGAEVASTTVRIEPTEGRGEEEEEKVLIDLHPPNNGRNSVNKCPETTRWKNYHLRGRRVYLPRQEELNQQKGWEGKKRTKCSLSDTHPPAAIRANQLRQQR